MAKTVDYPMKTPDKKDKGKVSQKKREEGGYGMAEKGGIVYPPKRKEKK